jgi:hypothetical protein
MTDETGLAVSGDAGNHVQQAWLSSRPDTSLFWPDMYLSDCTITL